MGSLITHITTSLHLGGWGGRHWLNNNNKKTQQVGPKQNPQSNSNSGEKLFMNVIQ
jgi:hypothetical protein